jgi:hypothetical protein
MQIVPKKSGPTAQRTTRISITKTKRLILSKEFCYENHKSKHNAFMRLKQVMQACNNTVTLKGYSADPSGDTSLFISFYRPPVWRYFDSVCLSLSLLEKDELQNIKYTGTEIFLPSICIKKIFNVTEFVTQEYSEIYSSKTVLNFLKNT